MSFATPGNKIMVPAVASVRVTAFLKTRDSSAAASF